MPEEQALFPFASPPKTPVPPAPPPATLPHVKGSPTSQAAAQRVAHSATSDAERVWRHLNSVGAAGATDEEIETALGMKHQTASARRRGLVLAGRVVDSGRTRKTTSGCQATVWVTVWQNVEEVTR